MVWHTVVFGLATDVLRYYWLTPLLAQHCDYRYGLLLTVLYSYL